MISYRNINSLFNIVKKLNLDQKREIKGMSSNRADIFMGSLILIKYLICINLLFYLLINITNNEFKQV